MKELLKIVLIGIFIGSCYYVLEPTLDKIFGLLLFFLSAAVLVNEGAWESFKECEQKQ